MNPEIHHNIEHNSEVEENLIEECLLEAGLFRVSAPKYGSISYQRIIEAATAYMSEVKKVETVNPHQSLSRGYSEREDYYQPESKNKVNPSSDLRRREYHNKLAILLLGRRREDLSELERDQVSNFAAYVTHDEDYINSW